MIILGPFEKNQVRLDFLFKKKNQKNQCRAAKFIINVRSLMVADTEHDDSLWMNRAGRDDKWQRKKIIFIHQ